MAYNPFDDVIENDPAYMANGGNLTDEDPSTKALDITLRVQRPTPTPTPPVPDFISQGQQIRDKQEKLQKLQDLYTQSAFTQSMQPIYEQRQQEDFSDVQQTIGAGVAPIFESIAASETADRGKAKKEKNEQIKQQLGFGNRNQLSKLQMEQAKQYGYEPLTIGETFAAIPDFLYGDQAESFRKLANGEQLEEGDKFNILLSPLDAIDFLGVGVASGVVFKLLRKLKNKYKVPNLKEILDNPAFAGDGDVEEARQIFMGATPPQGLPIEQGGRGQTVMFDKPDVPGGSGASAKKTRAEINKIRGDKQKEEVDNLVLNYIQKNPGGTPQDMMKATGLSESQKQKSILRLKKSNPEILEKNLIMGKQSIYKNDIIKVLEGIGFDKSISYKELSDLVPTANQSQISTFFNQPLSQIPGDEAAKYTYKDLYPNVYGFGTKDFGDGKGVVRIKDGIINALNKVPEGEMIQIDDFSKKLGVSYNAVREAAGTDDKLLDKIEFRRILNPNNIDETDNMKKARAAYIKVLEEKLGQGPGGRETLLFFDGFLRSSSPESFGFTRKDFVKKSADGRNIFDKDAWYEWRMNRFVDDFGPNWRSKFDEEFKYINDIEGARDKANDEIAQFLEDKKKQYPNILKDLNYKDYELQISHNFPLAKTSKRDEFVDAGMMKGSSRLGFAVTNLKHHQRLESILYSTLGQIDFLKQNNKIPEGQIPQSANKLLAYVDKEAKKLGTVIYFKIDDKVYKAGREESPSPQALVQSFKNHINKIIKQNKGKDSYNPKKFKDKKFGERKVMVTGKSTGKVDVPEAQENVLYKKGGEVKPVRMAMGGDPLQNINQQQFSADPAIDQDYFQEAVDSGNLQAANLLNLFKVFKKPKAMATPSNVKQVEQARDPIPAPTGSQEIAPLPAGRQDFFFKSYFLDQLNSQNAPKASTPQGWREFLIKGRKVPEAEMMDTGILQYLEDTEKFFPNKKITKQDLETLYDTSPLGNLEVRVKDSRRTVELDDVPAGENTRDFLDYNADQGRARHKGAGNAKIDEAADEYFEVVVNVPQLPGQEKVFVNSGHFQEPNVLGFTRVGTYKNVDNQKVAVIQEMQTDMLTEVRKEQERLFAMVNALKRQRADLVNQVEMARNLGPGNVDYATNKLRQFDQKYPESLLNDLAQDNLIQPFPNIVAKELIPEKTRSLNAIQDDINKLSMANVEQYADPAYKTKIFDLAQEQTKILDDLMSMNRSSNYQEKLQDFKVPSTSDRDELTRIGQTDTYLPSDYNMKKLESFPPIPFNKQADYVDLLIKSTIKAAKQKGIDRVAIMPADIGANPRWGKSSDEAKKKFQNLYDKVGVQQLKNIAKKYDGTLNVEKIIDPSKTNRGLTFLNKNPDGEFNTLKQIETRKEISDVDRDKYYDEEITRIASGVNEPGTIVLTREISPGQMMDYYLVEGRGDATDVGYRMIPLKEGESADDALIKIVEYNPSAIDMYTISFDPSKLEEPMYLFKKKSGGTIDKDSLVSITDIYGEYGR